MNKFWHKVELFVDHLIPLCLVVLFIIIIVEFFFHELAYEIHGLIVVGDVFVVGVFTIDLVFKYIRVRNVPAFLRRYWLDIIAIFPFYLFFRLIDMFLAALPLSESLKSAQMVLHEGLEVEKEGQKIIREAGKSSRYRNLIRFIRPALRLPRFAKIASFFETPTGRHHHHERV